MQGKYGVGQIIPASGIYGVHHVQHRLPLEVTLLAGHSFPPCEKCDGQVSFQPLLLAPEWHGTMNVVLNSLPELVNAA
jgi:hypothetical protein